MKKAMLSQPMAGKTNEEIVATREKAINALEGKKMDLIQKDNRASFEMDCNHALQYFEDKGYCTMAYESVIGRGRIRILSEEEKFDALQEIMNQYHGDEKAYFNLAAISRTVCARERAGCPACRHIL